MATQSELEYMLGKAIVNMEFRRLMLEDAEAAAKSLDLELTPRQTNAINSIDNNKFDAWAQGFEFVREGTAFFW